MNDIQIFENTEFGSVRTVIIDDEPYFVGKDVAEILGYKDTSDAMKRHIDDEDKLTRCFTDSGQSREMYVINESGLYSLILSSKLPNAKAFKRWVTSEVLPSIRKHGAYATETTIDQILNDPDYGIKLLQTLKEERAKVKELKDENAIQKQQLLELQPKASYYDVVLNSPDLMSISEISKDYGWSAKRMNAYLHDKGIQYKQGKIWLLYQKYAEYGYTSTKTHPVLGKDGTMHTKMHTYWTQKGRLFIYDLLKKDGYMPLIEMEGNDA